NSSSRIEVDTTNTSVRFIDTDNIVETKSYKHLQRIAALCNTATYLKDSGGEKESGDPLEVGLLKMVFSSKTKPEEYHRRYPKLDEIPFSSDSKIMATLHSDGSNYYIAAKGAVEELLIHCSFVLEDNEPVLFTDAKRKQWLGVAETHAKN